MPIKIHFEESEDEIAWICDNQWELPDQLCALEQWIMNNKEVATGGRIIADIGFELRKNATGGGGTLAPETMKLASEMNIEIWFSEYGHGLSDIDPKD